MNSIYIDYVMRGVPRNYDFPFTNWEDNLKNCLLHTGHYFKNNNITFSSLYSQYIGTKGVGSNIINQQYSTNNGNKCHQYFELHFNIYAYLTNTPTAATSTMNSALYNGDCRNFTLETYDTIMSKSFNDLYADGSVHTLNDTKKINSFEQGLKVPTSDSLAHYFERMLGQVPSC